MTANTTTSTRRVAGAAVEQHVCADLGCLAAMLGVGWVTELPATLSKISRGGPSSCLVAGPIILAPRNGVELT